MTTKDEFDIIIVGGGPSAMGLLLGLLEGIPSGAQPYTIAVVERGTGGDNATVRQPQQWYTAAHTQSSYSNIISSVPQFNLNNRIIHIPTGKSLGGGTNINACLVTRAADDDFDEWPGIWRGGKKILDASDAILKFMERKQLEILDMDEEYKKHCCRSIEKLIKEPRPESFSDAVKRTGEFPSVVLSVPTATKKDSAGEEHHRVSYYESLIQPLLEKRPDLDRVVTFYEGAEVERILMENGRANGVQCTRRTTTGEEKIEISSRKEVILCCGAIHSPALLLVSGIGDPDDLKRLDIEHCIKVTDKAGSYPGVGRKMQDHLLIPRLFMSKKSPRQNGTPVSCIKGILNMEVPVENARNRQDQHTIGRFQLHISDGSANSQILPGFVSDQFRKHFDANEDIGGWRKVVLFADKFLNWVVVALVRFLLAAILGYSPLGYLMRYYTFGANVCLLNPNSTGSVSLRRKASGNSTSATSSPKPLPVLSDFDIVIDPGYLADERDIDALVSGFNATDDLRNGWFSEKDGFTEITPGWIFRKMFPLILGYGNDKKGDEWLRRYLAMFTCPYFHWCGSCAMGEPESRQGQDVDSFVVDVSLRVRGVEGLRVCDASVFPTCVSGPTSLTCASLGFAAAPIIMKDCTGKDQ